jgi:hypothetical protein
MIAESASYWLATLLWTEIPLFPYLSINIPALCNWPPFRRNPNAQFVVAQFFAGMVILGIADKPRFMRRVSIFTRSLVAVVPALLSGIHSRSLPGC